MLQRPVSLSPQRVALAIAMLACGPASAQDVARSLSITPSTNVSQTFTDSYRSENSTTAGRQAESITLVGVGLNAVSRGGRVQGTLDYGLEGLLYARDSEANRLQQRLSAAGRAELIEGHLDLNASASISRQPTSALGVQSVDGNLGRLNLSEVRSYSLQPVLHGVLGGVVDVQATANAGGSSGGSEIDSTASGVSLSLSQTGGGRAIGWALDGSHQVSDFKPGRRTTTDRAIASLVFVPDADLQVTLRAGAERTDLESVEPRTYDNYGAAILWTPSIRTRVLFDADRRQFGSAHQVSLEHRIRRTVLRFTDSRSLNDGRSTAAAGGSVTAYALFYDLFASQEPDPALRDLLVRGYLEANGISPDTLLGGGFLTSAVSIQRRQELSLAFEGMRSSLTVSAFQTTTERADTVSSATDDLLNGPLRQRGLSLTIAHRLTPTTSLSLNAVNLRTRSLAAADHNALDSLMLQWTTRTGRQSNLALSLRHAQYQSDTDPYSENVLSAAFSTRF